MALDAFMVLETLHCIRELDLPTLGSEPYLWPVMIRIDDLTLQTRALVDVVAPLVGNARVVIKNSMRAGQSADIPSSVGVLRARLEDSLFDTHLILVVALWDEDESPRDAVRAGFQAFVNELGAVFGDAATLAAIQEADRNKDEAAKAAIAKVIQERLEARVKSAIANSLSGPQKVAVKTGFLNLDDILASAFKGFSNAQPITFTLPLGAGPFNAFEIRGKLDVREVHVDRCQAQVNAVRGAQAAVDDVNRAIKQLQDELQHASPLEKPIINQQINQLRDEDLAIAQAALGRALTALSICRSRLPTSFPDEAEQAQSSTGLS